MKKTKTLFLLATLVCWSSIISAQILDSTKVKSGNFDTYDELRTKQKANGIETLTYLDSTFNYQVKIPNWLHLKETGSQTSIGGTLPAVNGIETSIIIQGFFKSSFRSFDEFKEIYLTGNKFGQPARYSKDHIWYGQDNKGIIHIPHGVKERVFTIWRNKVYHHLFVLLETRSAFLLIQFTATSETYDVNIVKFDEFMSEFKILDL